MDTTADENTGYSCLGKSSKASSRFRKRGNYVEVDEINIIPTSVKLAGIGTRLAECL